MGRSPSIEKLVKILGFAGKDGLDTVVHRAVGSQEPGYDGR
jgi:hypothetical protein